MTPAPAALTDVLETLHVVALPLRVRFRGIETRELALFRGPAGWGEFGPFLEYEPPEAARWLTAAIESAYAGWPAPVRERVPVNATVPAVPAAQVESVLARFPGCRTAKVKVAEPGQRLADDLDRVAAVRDILGPDGLIRIDANCGWDREAALDALTALAAYGLEYAEQPCPSVADLRAVRLALAQRGVDVPIAADESVRRVEDPLLVARAEAADLVVVKAPPLGGVREALRIVAECGLPAVISSALDSSVGMGAGVALAASLPSLPYACGLGTVRLLGGDITGDPLAPSDGWIEPRQVEPDPEAMQRWAAPDDRVSWWRERVAACFALLDQ